MSDRPDATYTARATFVYRAFSEVPAYKLAGGDRDRDPRHVRSLRLLHRRGPAEGLVRYKGWSRILLL